MQRPQILLAALHNAGSSEGRKGVGAVDDHNLRRCHLRGPFSGQTVAQRAVPLVDEEAFPQRQLKLAWQHHKSAAGLQSGSTR